MTGSERWRAAVPPTTTQPGCPAAGGGAVSRVGCPLRGSVSPFDFSSSLGRVCSSEAAATRGLRELAVLGCVVILPLGPRACAHV